MARMRKKLGAALVGAAALSLTLTACGGGGGSEEGGGTAEGGAIDTSASLGRRQLLAMGRQPAAGLPGVRRQIPRRRTPISRSRSPSTARTTTGPSSPMASWPATRPTSSPTTCPSTRSSSPRSSWCRWTRRSPRTASTSISTRKAWRICGRARTASATACRRTSTPSRSSTTRS